MANMSHSYIAEQKEGLRAEIRAQRRARGVTGALEEAPKFTEQLIALTTELGARTVSAYLSTPDEPDTRGFLAWARNHDVRVLLPISRVDGLMDWAEFDEGEVAGPYGVPEPAGEVLPPNAIDDVDLIILPASAAGTDGMRMGWGRGYFDKLLGSMENLPPTYAVVYDTEFLETVPSEPHDYSVHGVVTPSGIHRIE